MCQIIIDSKVSEIDTRTLEIRLENLLQLLGTQFKAIYVLIRMKCEVNKPDLNYRCEIEGVSQTSSRLMACSEDSHMMSAVRSAVIKLGQELTPLDQPGTGRQPDRPGEYTAIGRAV